MCHDTNELLERFDDPIESRIHYTAILGEILEQAGWQSELVETKRFPKLFVTPPGENNSFEIALLPNEAVARRCNVSKMVENGCTPTVINYNDIEAAQNGGGKKSRSLIVEKINKTISVAKQLMENPNPQYTRA